LDIGRSFAQAIAKRDGDDNNASFADGENTCVLAVSAVSTGATDVIDVAFWPDARDFGVHLLCWSRCAAITTRMHARRMPRHAHAGSDTTREQGARAMTVVTTHYRTYTSRRRRRAGATAMDIAPPAITTVTNPGIYQALAFPSVSWIDGNGATQMANFAFWSVAGTSSTPGSVSFNPQLSVDVAGDPLTAVAWYVPNGDGPPGIGWEIDAFDVDAGGFVLDDFVNVTTDPSLTADANYNGWVPTAQAQTIEAYNAISAGPFQLWDIVSAAATQTSRDLQAAQNSSGLSFAFFQRQRNSGMPKLPHYDIWTWVSRSVMVDGGGPTGNGPVDPWGPELTALLSGVALGRYASKVQKELRGELLNVASKQVLMSAEKIVAGFKER